MKKILFILLSIIISCSTAYAQDNKSIEIMLYGDDIKGHQVDPEEAPKTRGIVIQPVHAYLYNKVVTVTFVEVSTAASVRIIQESTGETVYSQDYISPSAVTIDLNSMGAGTYRIEIATDDSCLEGEFML